MRYITEVFGGLAILIGIYLVLSHGGSAISLLNTFMQSATNGIRVLQGRG